MGYTAGPGEDGAPDRKSRIRRILFVILALNLAVALAKLGWGYVAGSVSMVADGFHSLFDGASNVIGLVGLALAARPADRDHPYGHGKYETYASAAIGAMLAFAAYSVGSAAIGRLLEGSPPPRVDAIAFGVMFGTLAINVCVTLYERAAGKRLGSEILIADASHTGSDALVSIGVIAGLVAVRAGYPIADPLIALAVSGVIAYTALNVFRQATVTLSDTARIDPKLISRACMEVPGVLGCHHIRTRGSAAEVYVDLHIQVDPAATVTTGHAVAEAVEREVCRSFESVVDVVAHLEPYDAYQVDKTVKEIDAGLA